MITTVKVNGVVTNLYMDGGLYNQLTTSVMPSVQKKDFDWLAIVDGSEGCLSGDTLVNTNRCTLGRKFSLKKMYYEYHNNRSHHNNKGWNLNHPTYVRSFDDKTIRLHKIKDVVYSGKKEVWLLSLVNGKSIKATKDHKIMTSKGWKELITLTTEDKVMCDTLKPQKGNQRSFKMEDIDIHVLFHPNKNKHESVEVHRLIYESYLNNLKFIDFLDILWNDETKAKTLRYVDSTKFDIHHKDDNHYNNCIDNLELINKGEHQLYHSKSGESFRHFNQGVPEFINVESIKQIGIEDTYDIICEEPYHNFVANGILVHNSGKSWYSMQVAKVLDPNFDLDNIAFTPDEFVKKVINAKKNACIVFDEAFTGLSSRQALSEINNLLVSLMMEMRQKNLFIIIVMPTFFMLDKYCVLHRAKGLFHIYLNKGKRGFWNFYNRKGMKLLYLNGKKYYEYSGTKPVMFGRFQDQCMVNEKEYRALKKQHLYQKRRITKVEKYIEQRDTLFWILSQEFGLSQQEISNNCNKLGFKIARKSISEILIKFKMQQDKKSIFESKNEEELQNSEEKEPKTDDF